MGNALLQDNALQVGDRAAHDWYRFVLSFPPHLVRHYLDKFSIDQTHLVLDPFCGTGTTLVECKKLGIQSTGIEANPMAAFASAVKTDWLPEPELLRDHASRVAELALARLQKADISDEFFLNDPRRGDLKTLEPEQQTLILTGSISALPLHKVLVLQECLSELRDNRYEDHVRVALAKTIVTSASNLRFGPEVGVGKPRDDAAVISSWTHAVNTMAKDLTLLRDKRDVQTRVVAADARHLHGSLEPTSVDFVFTSPPYPNEKDYTRTTRLESVILGFINTRVELRRLKQGLVRSNTRNVYKGDDDDRFVEDHSEVQRIATEIEERRKELGKTSGFERMYARVTKLYFGGMARHLEGLKPILKPGAILAYVVGDQASYLRVMIRTGQLLADIARSRGYKVIGIDLFRTRLATATKEQLREEVVLLQWEG